MAKHLSLTPYHVANVHQTLPDQGVPQVEGRDQMLNGLDWPLTVRMVHLDYGRGLPTIGTAQRMQTNVATGVVTWIAVSAGALHNLPKADNRARLWPRRCGFWHRGERA